ncbi:MAG: efflux RND transporter permease subunit [Myxococcaceae bacterium]
MADSNFMQRIEQALGEVTVRVHRKPVLALLIAAVVTAAGSYAASKMRVSADLEKLLPQTFQSVRDLEPVRKRFGGIGYLVVVGMGGDEASLKRFADDYAAKIQTLKFSKRPGDPEEWHNQNPFRWVEYKKPFQFLDDRMLHYLDLEDVQEIQHRIKEYEKYQRRQMNPMFVKLDDEPPPSLDFSDIRAKYSQSSNQRLAGTGEYYVDPVMKMVVVMAKPSITATNLAFSQRLVEEVENFFAHEDLKQYGANFKVGLTGTYKYKVDQQKQITNDMTSASTLAAIILLIYLVFHFRSLLAVALVMVPVSCGLVWTYGITHYIFGSLNVLTGFLGAILGGLGTEHGIHLLGRYEVLRTEGMSSEDAVRDSFNHTGGSALVSSLVASLTFAAIAYSEFRAFREFGVIAAMGMPIVLAAYFPILPAILGLATRLGWRPSRGAAMAGASSELAVAVPRYAKQITFVVGAVLLFFIAQTPRVYFDFDFNSLEDSTLPSFLLDRETNKILGYSQEPVIILTQKPESERALVKAIKERQAERRKQGKASTVDFVGALDDLVPTQQEEKVQAFSEIRKILEKVNLEKLESERRNEVKQLLRRVSTPAFKREDIPESIQRTFGGLDRSAGGGYVLIFPAIKLSDGKAVSEFAKEVRGIELPNGDTFSAAGEAMILADVLEMVTRESAPIVTAALILVTLAMWLTLGSLRNALLCLSPTVLSLMGLTGLMGFLGIPFNYLNILIVPVLIGVTVDAGVHLISRLSDAHGNFGPVYAETGRAICGGLLTSAVGFGAMLLADHPGLNSLGRLANLGFAMNLVVMLVGFPALLLLVNRRQVAAKEAAPNK